MKFTFLGTGDAGGVPLYGCQCAACQQARTHSHLRRSASCALIETAHTRVLIDAGITDLTERFPAGSLSAILLTHFHPDHVQGLFHLRWGIGESIDVFAPPDPIGCADLYKNHGLLAFQQIQRFESFNVGDLSITALPLIHSKLTFGYFIETPQGHNIAYLTDTLGLPPETAAFLAQKNIQHLILDCSHPPHYSGRNHNNLMDVIEIAEQVKPQSTWITHLSHDMDLWLLDHNLPDHIYIGFDQKSIIF
ncbi:phosphonate metabolism protein PhnP [Acinetobacter sp. ANC 3813]|uniref:phosphonate metabolism protein PhnP n=1 Tax=Acinetobacter sp. ANC 3813 TaxID=1977873 RepID=UPI000A32E7BD|nr:phosphonate metabolism protein PhnP [Acinetobacter sp. ANC 3813]OTG88535.1 phosphonate metabolism protein PhnP [Acinetobacter sp. ANC 3813]